MRRPNIPEGSGVYWIEHDKFFPSKREAAECFGFTPQTIAKWIKKDGGHGYSVTHSQHVTLMFAERPPTPEERGPRPMPGACKCIAPHQSRDLELGLLICCDCGGVIYPGTKEARQHSFKSEGVWLTVLVAEFDRRFFTATNVLFRDAGLAKPFTRYPISETRAQAICSARADVLPYVEQVLEKRFWTLRSWFNRLEERGSFPLARSRLSVTTAHDPKAIRSCGELAELRKKGEK